MRQNWLSKKYEIIGESPLLMHNGQLANFFNPIVQEMKKISKRRNKGESDLLELSRLEWHGGLYLSDKKPCIPGEIMEACLIKAAKTMKKGNQAKASLQCPGNFPLIYEGPKDIEKLWKDEGFRHISLQVVDRSKVLRTRAIFKDWSAIVTVEFNKSDFDEAEIDHLMEIAGNNCGLMDGRPKFGRFSVKRL